MLDKEKPEITKIKAKGKQVLAREGGIGVEKDDPEILLIKRKTPFSKKEKDIG